MVSVHKGDWDKSRGPDANHAFNRAWLAAAQRVLKPNGSIWVSGTAHVIHSVGFAMQQLGFKLLNDISWVKPNPPPNLSCRYFTHATETIIWAAKNARSRHIFNYKLMKETNRGKQMKSVWEIKPPEPWEKRFGKHPTQKPVALLERILLASSNEGDLVLDPFSGSGTTALAALRLHRRALACELSADFLALSFRRICSNLVHVRLSLFSLHFSIDPSPDPMDRSNTADATLSFRAQRGICLSGCASAGAAQFAVKGGYFSAKALAVILSGAKNPSASAVLGGASVTRKEKSPSRSSTFNFQLSTTDSMSPQLQLVQLERRFYFIGRDAREVIFSTLADSLDDARQKFRNSGHHDSAALFIIATETSIYLA